MNKKQVKVKAPGWDNKTEGEPFENEKTYPLAEKIKSVDPSVCGIESDTTTAVMNFAIFLYFVVFLLAFFLYFRLEKVDPYKNFYIQFPDQQKCIRDLLFPYTRERNIELFSALSVFINQCSYNLLRVYFETVRDGYRSALFLPGENENNDGLVSHSQFLFSSEENCVIVHASESTLDVRLELKMKKKWPLCKVVKVNSQAAPDENNQIEVVRAKLKLTFEHQNLRRDRNSVDLDTLMRVFLNSRYIEALYLDEFVSVDELFQFSEQKDFAKLFPVCQLTMVIPKPKNKSDETKFWNFILYFVVDSPLVLVSSRVVNQDKIDLVFYNPEYKTCNFKHFSIPFSKEGVKF